MSQISLLRSCTQASLTLFIFTPAFAAIQLSDDPSAGGGALNYRITPDSSRVVYTAEMNTAGITELFSALTSVTGTQIQISDMPVAGGELSGGIEVTPDGTSVVFSGDLESDQQFELFSASTSMPDMQVKLNDTPSHMGVVTVQPKLTPDGARVLYRGDLLVDGEDELFSALVGMADTQIRLTSTPVAGGGVMPNDFFPTADGTRVVYLADLDNDNVDELYSAPTDAPNLQIKLNNVSAVGGDIDDDFLLTSDGARVIYRGPLDTLFLPELYSAPTGEPGMQIKLNGPPVPNSGGVSSLFRLTPDGSRVIYRGVLDTAGVTELYSAPTNQPNMQIKLNNTPVEDGDVGASLMTPDGARAVFMGDLAVNDQQDLYSAPVDMENGQIQLNTNTAGGNVGQPLVISPDSSRVVYPGDMNVLGQRELYSAPTDAENMQITLSTNLLGDAGDMVGSSILSPDGSRVAYRGVLTTAGITDLYIASTTAQGTQVALTNFTTAQLIVNPIFTPDSQFLIYGVDTDGDFAQDVLFAADALGQSPPVPISDPLIAGGIITQFLITPDSQKVIYRANQDDLNVFNLYASSIAAPPMGLPGDYNNDGTVDAADYTVFRDNLGTDFNLNGNGDETGGSAGIVDQADYELWVAHFGESAGSGAANLAPGDSPGANYAVPEPAALVLLLGGLLLLKNLQFRTRPDTTT